VHSGMGNLETQTNKTKHTAQKHRKISNQRNHKTKTRR